MVAKVSIFQLANVLVAQAAHLGGINVVVCVRLMCDKMSSLPSVRNLELNN